MSARLTALTGTESHFAPDEIIVSKTDPRGIITYANEVFIRVSGYSEEELLGAPHSIIRHPDMPRAVFKLLWDTIQAGHEIFAYVVNRAKNGNHYWVLAHVTPTFGKGGAIVGYHSNRRVPARPALAKIIPLYGQLLAEERRHGMAGSTRLLHDLLAKLGSTYDAFVWSLINSGGGTR